jgi:rhamnose utilization protein RhaD (predicted bifunctional aldolase and dehydrogenase)
LPPSEFPSALPADAVRDLVAISRFAGSSVLLAQGAGGNTSVKFEGGLLIKTSGFRLDEVTETQGWVAVTASGSTLTMPESVAAGSDLVARPAAAWKPSMEISFHEALGRTVIHTHPVFAVALACLSEGRSFLEDRVSPEDGITWVPYRTPGPLLGAAVAQENLRWRLRYGQAPRAFVLENHGLISQGETAAEAMRATQSVLKLLESLFGPLPRHATERMAAGTTPNVDLPHAVQRWATYRILAEDALRDPDRWLESGPLVPDDVVVFGGHAYRQRHLRSGQAPERLALILPGQGLLLCGPNARTVDAMEEGLVAHVLARMLAERLGRPLLLPRGEEERLLELESEKHRQAVLARH